MAMHTEAKTGMDWSAVRHVLQSGIVNLVNMQREQNRKPIDYVQFNLPSQMPQLPTPRNIIQQRLFGRTALSLLELEQAFERIADDKGTKGVILFLRDLSMPLADLQTIRGSMKRLRERGKRIVCFAHEYGIAEYYVASAADEILLQPGGGMNTTGLLAQQVFFKEGLNSIGLEMDVVQITPYKGALDTLARSEPSEEGQAQMNWLIDSQYEMLLAGIAEGRGIEVDAARSMIDQSPVFGKVAQELGYVDGVLNEEGLQAHLGTKEIYLWEQANQMLPLKPPKSPARYVGVLRAGGSIVPGESQDPPIDIPIPIVGGERMGDATVVRHVRNLISDERCVALVFYIDSGGGSATASEAMASALDEFAKKKPLVVYMGGVAASGGYYIATPAQHIVAQPGTITGSIGVINAKLVSNEALQKLKFNPFIYQRGKNAALFSSLAPFSDEERAKVREAIETIYELFLQRVADSRKMKRDTVDAIGGGRVWTGQQALEHGLVDELGGLYEALAKARELANVPADTPMGIVRGRGKPLPAQLAEQVDPAAAVRYWQSGLGTFAGGHNMLLMPFELDW